MDVFVKTVHGNVVVSDVQSSWSTERLKQAICSSAACPAGLPRTPNSWRLVHQGKRLDGGLAGVKHGDSLVCLLQRSAPAPPPPETIRVVSRNDVISALQNEARQRNIDVVVPPVAAAAPAISEARLVELNAELQRILMRIDGAATALRSLPTASAATRAVPVPPEPSAADVDMLMSMGFSQRLARKALILCRNRVQAAAEWLLEHSGDADADADVTDEQLQQLYGEPRRQVVSRAAMLDHIVDMGFTAEHAEQALSFAHNDLEAALQWLFSSATQDAATQQ